jgi:hypothetical protein
MASPQDYADRRGEEVRCPACVRFKPVRGPCPLCGCGEVPPERFGAARVLLRAGVDRFSLAGRVAALAPQQAELMERQFAAQWAWCWPTIEEVRRCEAHLVQSGFVEEAEEQLVERLPTDPSLLAQEAQPLETLEALFKKSTSWLVQRLAALALVHQGNLSRELLYSVSSSLFDEGRVAVEAAFALTRWRVWQWARIGQEGWTRVREVARKAMSHAELAPRAAVAWVRATGEDDPQMEVLFALRSGLQHPDADLRFECALVLKDEAGLLAALESPDARVVAEARRMLASLGSSRLLERLAREGGTAFARDVADRLGLPLPSGALEALLSVSERGPDRIEEALRRLIERQPFAQWPELEQARWSTWARAVLRELPGEVALRFLQWAAEPPVVPEAARAFVEATAEALAREPADVRARSLGDSSFSRFLAVAGPLEESLLSQWAREAECAPPLMEALMTLTSHVSRWEEPPGQAARLLMAVWEGPGREALLGPLTQSVRGWSGIVGRQELIDAVWQRFQRHPDERADLLSAFAPWRQELWERQLASPEDAVARFEAWWSVDPEGFYRQADLLMREAPVRELPRRVRCVLAAAADVVATRPRTASLAVFYAAAALANAFRAGADELVPEVERFLEWFPGFEQRVRTTPPEQEGRAPIRDFLEELHTEVRLMRERLEALREEEDRKWQAELRRKVEESRRRDLERQARDAERAAEEARRAREEAQRAAELSRVATVEPVQAVETGVLLTSLRPRIESKPIDHEVIFPGRVLPTLLDFVRLLQGMKKGDALKAMMAAGLDVTTWPAEANAWGQAMTQRMELGLRFAELMAAPWD